MKNNARALSLLFVLATAIQPAVHATDTVDPALYENLEWREIGPWRGGRVVLPSELAATDDHNSPRFEHDLAIANAQNCDAARWRRLVSSLA